MDMKLELASFPVKDVRFGKQTSYKNGVLEVNKDEVTALVLEDERIASADLDVVLPGEQTRIALIRDAVEPRVKVSGPGCVFPGILGPIETVGEGRTHRLSGVTVIVSGQYRPTITTGVRRGNFSIVDMWEPGSLLSPFGSTINIVLILKLIDKIDEAEAHTAIQLAEFKVAQRLAETTRHVTPENTEIFELPEVDPSLPRVVYILSALTAMPPYPHTLVAFYGMPIEVSLPFFIHPNEFFDGVLTSDARKGNSTIPLTWEWMNEPVVLELLREHGKRLNFLGVIVQRTRFTSEPGKRVSAAATSQMARLLGADGVIITLTSPSGANFIDVMFTVQACERKGVKTVLITPDGGNSENELPLTFSVPEATAIVSTGVTHRELKLPAPAKVIGAENDQLVTSKQADRPYSPWEEITFIDRYGIACGCDWLGTMNYTCKEY